jgi:hypothetical protein
MVPNVHIVALTSEFIQIYRIELTLTNMLLFTSRSSCKLQCPWDSYGPVGTRSVCRSWTLAAILGTARVVRSVPATSITERVHRPRRPSVGQATSSSELPVSLRSNAQPRSATDCRKKSNFSQRQWDTRQNTGRSWSYCMKFSLLLLNVKVCKRQETWHVICESRRTYETHFV